MLCEQVVTRYRLRVPTPRYIDYLTADKHVDSPVTSVRELPGTNQNRKTTIFADQFTFSKWKPPLIYHQKIIFNQLERMKHFLPMCWFPSGFLPIWLSSATSLSPPTPGAGWGAQAEMSSWKTFGWSELGLKKQKWHPRAPSGCWFGWFGRENHQFSLLWSNCRHLSSGHYW